MANVTSIESFNTANNIHETRHPYGCCPVYETIDHTDGGGCLAGMWWGYFSNGLVYDMGAAVESASRITIGMRWRWAATPNDPDWATAFHFGMIDPDNDPNGNSVAFGVWLVENTSGLVNEAFELYAEWGAWPTDWRNSGSSYKFLNALDGEWHHIEMDLDLIADTARIVIDGGAVDYTFTSVNYSHQNVGRYLYFNGFGSQGNPPVPSVVHVDNIYIVSGGDLLGQNTTVEVLVPNAIGDDTGFSSSLGPTGKVSSITDVPADDGDYNYTTARGAVADSYQFTNLDTSKPRTVHSVQVKIRCRKTNTATTRVRPFVLISGTKYYGTGYYIGNSYREIAHVWPTNPATSADWTAAEVNSAQFGYEQMA